MFHKYCDVKNDDLISFEDVEWDGISQQPKIAEDSDEIRRLKKLVEDLTKQVDIYKKRYENMWKVYKELAGSPFASTEKRASSTTENSVADKKVNIRDYFEPLLDLADAQSRSPVPTPPSHLARNTKVGEPNKAAQQAGTILVLEDIEPQEDRLFETSTKEEVRTSKSPDEKIEKLEDFFRFEAVKMVP
ncbi:hypothetical protein QR680_003763 [Steinernema hermaphroditum]|uniref:Uncharacterized protein n=1 Tax=Steinernema hermaphroditum TaxID=289476 RepID=A0AA39LSW1_9BILA|nr:hypothetical protein QR680_003763 [Steinernema hermaphroditum]